MPPKRKAPAPADSPSKRPRAITTFFAASGSGDAGAADGSEAKPASSSAAATTGFDKAAWEETLTAEQRELLALERDTLHESWLEALRDVLVSPPFLQLKRFLAQERRDGQTVYPPERDIYSWSRLCPLATVKVVILGQDPYHGRNQAHGLSFSVRPPTPAPPSLANIFRCLKNDYPDFTPPAANGGLLEPWATQGALMLNACLTVRAGRADSHKGRGWEALTGRVIELVARRRVGGVVFMAWGRNAQERCRNVDKTRHLVLQSVHPSPLSAHKGFMDCGHFKKANAFLKSRYGEKGMINWNLGANAASSSSSSTAKKPAEAEAGGNPDKAVVESVDAKDAAAPAESKVPVKKAVGAAGGAAVVAGSKAATDAAAKAADGDNDDDADEGKAGSTAQKGKKNSALKRNEQQQKKTATTTTTTAEKKDREEEEEEEADDTETDYDDDGLDEVFKSFREEP